MIQRVVPRPAGAGLPYLHTSQGCFLLPSTAAAVRMAKILEHYNEIQRVRAQRGDAGGILTDEQRRDNADVVALMAALVGAMWHSATHDLETVKVAGAWRALDMSDRDAVIAWGDTVAAELNAAGWRTKDIAATFDPLADALVAVTRIEAGAVKAAADFSEAPTVTPPAP